MSHQVAMRIILRTLFKTPFVTAVAILSLALGIGANSAIYSIFDGMLRRPLPVPRPTELVNLGAPGPKPGSQSCNDAGDCEAVFSYPMFRDLEREAPARTALSGLAAHRSFGANLTIRSATRRVDGVQVSGGYFPLLELTPAAGRLLTPADDQTIGAHRVAVLANDFWEGSLGSDSTILNETVRVNGQAFTVIGIAPRGFRGTTLGIRPAFYIPITTRGLFSATPYRGFTTRTMYWVYVFGRLDRGATIDQLRAPLNAIYRPILADVEAPLQLQMSEETMGRFRAREIDLADGRMGQSDVHGEARTPIMLLFTVTGIVLLIACANVANLLLARAADRSTEIAVRLSLGATRWRILRQLLLESLVLASFAGVLSLLVAHWTLGAITSLIPEEAAQAMQFRVDGAAVGFAAVLSLLTGVVFGLFPALHSSRPDLVSALRSGSGKLAGARTASRFRSALATAQIALSMALLIGSGLFVRSLHNVSRLDLGLDVDDVVTFALWPARNGYAPPRSRALFERVEGDVRALPGVTAVATSVIPLLAGSSSGQTVSVQGFQKGPDTDASSRYNLVGPGYLKLFGIPLLSGREFTPADRAGAPRVAMVNETFARKFGLGREAVGKLMSTGNDSLGIEIVGLMKDAKYSEVKDEIPPLFFLPALQDTTLGGITFYARVKGDAGPVLRMIPALIRGVDATLPVEELRSMPQQIRDNVFLDRLLSILSASFAMLATVLAAIGLYGVLAYSVAQRTREIGVRMALGADAPAVRRMVIAQVGRMTAIGAVIGVAGAIAIGKGARSLLFEVGMFDPVVSAVAAVLLVVVSLSAGYLPARRASRVDPMQALRYE